MSAAELILGASLEGVGQGHHQRAYVKVNEKLIYFYPPLSNNHSPAVGNDSQNGIFCCRWAAIICEYIVTNNIILALFLMDHNMVVCYSYARHKIDNRKTCTCFASHFDSHADQAVRCRAHHPVRQV